MLETSIKKFNKMAAGTAKKFERLGIKTLGDLLLHFPFRYEDYRQVVTVNNLAVGSTGTVKVRLELIANRRAFRRKLTVTETVFTDDTGSLRVVWYNQPFVAKTLKVGEVVCLAGKITSDRLGLVMSNPSIVKDGSAEKNNRPSLTPIYATTAGLTQKQIRYLVSEVLSKIKNERDWLPDTILDKYDLMPIWSAYQGIHFPQDEIELAHATKRLKFNELFLLQLKNQLFRQIESSKIAPMMVFKEVEIKKFVADLPFQLTKGQKVSAWEIIQDLGKPQPMNRLLSGDVGSGKTIVAGLAIYNTILNGFQAVVMAPTEILARQHYETLCKLFGDKAGIVLLTSSQCQSNCHPELVSGSPGLYRREREILKCNHAVDPRLRGDDTIVSVQDDGEQKPSKKQITAMIQNGTAQIIIGTQSLISDKIIFNNVGLVVVDEQHRFGVRQRQAVKDKTDSQSAHYLSMTATPIPRSLALVIYGDLQISQIRELPVGRKPIITKLVDETNRAKAYEFMRAEMKNGRQIFVVCPLIEEAEKDPNEIEIINYYTGNEKKSVMQEYEKLSGQVFADCRVGYLHGQQKSVEKEATMKKFKDHELDILVATAVVEVGVDIPNASVMMIEGADRFGLAQLHQFRGRVGRSVHQSYCLVCSGSRAIKTKERLNFFTDNLDGFKLAEKDLETRGPGEVYGVTQSGLVNLQLAKLTDVEIVKNTKDAIKDFWNEIENHPPLVKMIANMRDDVHLE